MVGVLFLLLTIFASNARHTMQLHTPCRTTNGANVATTVATVSPLIYAEIFGNVHAGMNQELTSEEARLRHFGSGRGARILS